MIGGFVVPPALFAMGTNPVIGVPVFIFIIYIVYTRLVDPR